MRDIASLPQMIAKVFADAPLVKWTFGIILGCTEYFFPTEQLQSAASCVAVFIALDTLTGIVAASVTGKAITSAKLGRVLIKCLGYSAVIVVVGMASKNTLGFGKSTDAVLVTLLGAMMATEGLSVLENVRNMKVWVPPFVEKMLRDRLQRPEISAPAKAEDAEADQHSGNSG